MTYKQWLDWYNKEPFDYPPNSRDGWLACKNQILKILNNEQKNNALDDRLPYFVIKELIDKIKKEI